MADSVQKPPGEISFLHFMTNVVILRYDTRSKFASSQELGESSQ